VYLGGLVQLLIFPGNMFGPSLAAIIWFLCQPREKRRERLFPRSTKPPRPLTLKIVARFKACNQGVSSRGVGQRNS